MALRLRPTDTSFYDLFTTSAQHLVTGAGLLAEMLGEGADREDVAKRMREAEHVADETTHAIVRKVNSTFVTPFDREDIYSLASGLDDVMDDLDEVVDLILLYEVDDAARRSSPTQVEVLAALRRADRRGDAAAAVDDRTSRSTGSRSTASRTPATRATAGPSPSCSAATSRRSRC